MKKQIKNVLYSIKILAFIVALLLWIFGVVYEIVGSDLLFDNFFAKLNIIWDIKIYWIVAVVDLIIIGITSFILNKLKRN